MTLADLRQIVKKWDLESSDDDPNSAARYTTILRRLEYFGGSEWRKYLPCVCPEEESDYSSRLAKWVANVSDENEQKTLLEYALYVSFISHEDIISLYSSAFVGPIARWVIELENLTLAAPDFQRELARGLFETTWYCPVTDSMDINEFYHVNHLESIKHRPSFATVAMLDRGINPGDDSLGPPPPNERFRRNLFNYLKNPDPANDAPAIKRLVLLEDFVGSGTQASSALRWAAKNLEIPVLFVPLLICPQGKATVQEVVQKFPDNLKCEAIIEVEAAEILGQNPACATWPSATIVEELAKCTFPMINTSDQKSEDRAPFNPFGYKETGCSIATYSNTPNNSLPMLHHKSHNWKPLFPRVSRI